MLIPQELQLSQKELMSVAAKIADNLTFADDVSDEDVKHKPILAEYIETENQILQFLIDQSFFYVFLRLPILIRRSKIG